MAAGINPMLAMALMGGQGNVGNGMNPMMMDPSFLQYQNQMQYGQNLLQEGSDASPAYPMQALARALAGITGAYTMNRAVGKLGQGAGGPPNPANEKAMIEVLGGESSPLGRLWINGNRLQRYYIESSLPAISSSQAGPQVTKPGETVTAGLQAPVVTNAGPQTDFDKEVQFRNQAVASKMWTPDQIAAADAKIALEGTKDGYTLSHDQQGNLVAQPLANGPADPKQVGALEGAKANATVPAQEAVVGFKGAVDSAVQQNAPQKTAPGEQFSVNPNRVPIPGVSVPAVPAVAAQPVVPPSGVATPAVQPAMPAQPVAPPVVPQPIQQGAPAEAPQLRPEAPIVPGVTGAGPEGMQISPTLTAGATPLAPPPQGASPATPVPPPVVPGPTAATPPSPTEIKQSGGETITGNPYPPADILKGRYDQYNKLSDAAGQAREEGQKAQLLQQKLDQLGMGGPGVPFLANLTRFAQEAGVAPETIAKFGLPNGATEEQANKLSIDLLGEVLKAQFPQRITNNDIVLFKKTVAGPGLMPESSKFLIDNIVMPKVQRDIDRFGAVVDLPGKDRALDTFNRSLFDFDNKHPLSSYTPSLQPAKPPAGAPANSKLAPDGNWYAPDPARQGKWLKVVAPNG